MARADGDRLMGLMGLLGVAVEVEVEVEREATVGAGAGADWA